jgi:hypothetical protein
MFKIIKWLSLQKEGVILIQNRLMKMTSDVTFNKEILVIQHILDILKILSMKTFHSQ